MVCISNFNILKLIYCVCFHSVVKYGIFWGVTLPTVWMFLLYKKKIFRIIAVAQTRTSCKSLFKQLEIFFVPCQFILSLMYLIVSHQENFQIHLYTILIQGINTIFIDQMPICLVFKRYILCWHQNFQHFTSQADIPQEWQGKIQSSTKKMLKYTP